jgi:hypothetical protein
VQVIGGLSEFAKQALAGLGGEAVRDAYQISLLMAGRLQDIFNGNGRSQEYSSPASRFRQAQEIHHPCHVYTLPQGGCNYCLRHTLSNKLHLFTGSEQTG